MLFFFFFRRRSRVCHPDKCSHPKGTEAFQKLALAYETLLDPVKRRDYIYSLTLKRGSTFDRTRPSGTQAYGSNSNSFAFAESIDIKEALGLFAFVASNFASLGVEKSFFHKAADALALIDLYQKRNMQENRTKSKEKKEQIELKDVELGLRAVGTVITIGAALYSAFAGTSKKESKQGHR